MSEVTSGPDPLPEIHTLGMGDVVGVLRAGAADFLRAPLFGLFFSAVYVAGGMLLWRIYSAAGQEWWIAPLAVGFPLLGPFAAVGLYEVSRQFETGARPTWGGVLGVVFAQRTGRSPPSPRSSSSSSCSGSLSPMRFLRCSWGSGPSAGR